MQNKVGLDFDQLMEAANIDLIKSMLDEFFKHFEYCKKCNLMVEPIGIRDGSGPHQTYSNIISGIFAGGRHFCPKCDGEIGDQKGTPLPWIQIPFTNSHPNKIPMMPQISPGWFVNSNGPTYGPPYPYGSVSNTHVTSGSIVGIVSTTISIK